ncbi:MAG: hypothetical protein HQ519_11160 [Planctomycetes bacterium]|nr:hypothetical protein [Planctomycetota bacterium]
MKGIPILILLAFFAGAVIGAGFGNGDEPVVPLDRGTSPITFKNVAAQNRLAKEPVETQVLVPAHGANEVASQRLPQRSGLQSPGIRQDHTNGRSLTSQSPLDRPRSRTVGHLSELVGSSQQRALFEAAQMLHPELENLDPLDLYFDDVTWPY